MLTKTSEAHISVEVDSNMAVDAGEFRRALESVATFLKFLRFTASKKNAQKHFFKGKDVYASLPTGTGNNQSNHFPHIPEKVTWSLNTIINGKSQTFLSDFFEGRGGCTQARMTKDVKNITTLGINQTDAT